MNLISNIVRSLSNDKTGFSGKKLTALVATVFCFVIPIDTWTYWAYKHNDFSLLTALVVSIGTFILALFGINVVDKYKNKETANDTETKE
jgi:F0F1-type ATP synthase membrane subunit a